MLTLYSTWFSCLGPESSLYLKTWAWAVRSPVEIVSWKSDHTSWASRLDFYPSSCKIVPTRPTLETSLKSALVSKPRGWLLFVRMTCGVPLEISVLLLQFPDVANLQPLLQALMPLPIRRLSLRCLDYKVWDTHCLGIRDTELDILSTLKHLCSLDLSFRQLSSQQVWIWQNCVSLWFLRPLSHDRKEETGRGKVIARVGLTVLLFLSWCCVSWCYMSVDFCLLFRLCSVWRLFHPIDRLHWLTLKGFQQCHKTRIQIVWFWESFCNPSQARPSCIVMSCKILDA